MQTLGTEFAGTTSCGGAIQLPAHCRRSILRNIVALYVSLYWSLLSLELPFQENLSEGSVLFGEYFLCSILEGLASNGGGDWARRLGLTKSKAGR